MTGLALVAGLLFALLFAGTQAALMALLENPAERDRAWLPARLEDWLASPSTILQALSLGNLASLCLAGTVLASILIEHCGYPCAPIVGFVILAPLAGLVNELIPRFHVRPKPAPFLTAYGLPLVTLSRLAEPFAAAGERVTGWLARSLEPLMPAPPPALPPSASTAERAEPGAEDLFESVLEFSGTLAKEVMVPRRDMVALPADAGLDTALALVRESQYSRIPVYRGVPENVIGVVHSKDLLPFARGAAERGFSLSSLARQPLYVPGVMTLDDLLAELQLKATHMAFVVDEFGSTSGLITLEDVIEEIFGDIQDEHDTEELSIRRTGRANWLVDGTATIEEVEDALHVELPERDCETFGGLVFATIGHLPEPGEACNLGRLRAEVLRLEHHRIRDINVTLLGPRERGRAAVGG
jgi:CBS domain containing-hemolysin-like protein